jgi:hypothetical protein
MIVREPGGDGLDEVVLRQFDLFAIRPHDVVLAAARQLDRLLRLFERELADFRAPRTTAVPFGPRNLDVHVVAVRGVFARDVEGHQVDRVGADGGGHRPVASELTHPPADLGVLRAPFVEHLIARPIRARADGPVVERVHIARSGLRGFGEEVLDRVVQTRQVVRLNPREVRQQLAHAPSFASGVARPNGFVRRFEETADAFGLGIEELERIEIGDVRCINHASS